MDKQSGEAAVTEAECGPCPSLHYTVAFAVQRMNIHGKTSGRAAEKCVAEQCWARFIGAARVRQEENNQEEGETTTKK